MDAISKKLAKGIMKIIREGFFADEGVVHYIDSTLGQTDPEMLRQLLSVAEDSDDPQLVDLIVSPDTEAQSRLEPILEEDEGGQRDAETILAFIPSTVETSFYLPGINVKIPFKVSKSSVARFLDQLNIPRTIDGRIHAALEKRLNSRAAVLRARVMIRNARLPIVGEQVPMFVQFLASFKAEDNERFFEAMALLLAMLGRQLPEKTGLALLGREKERRLRQVRSTEQLEQDMVRKNMETMMLQGGRGLLASDKGAMFWEIGIIDRIALAVFGEMPRDPEGHGGETDGGEPPSVSFSFEKRGGG
ncbi:MAG: hypothetical protein SWH68_04525 [Thermodesulfobacteriota bacterium]|nr:hypothetical protein [Thermodesulfobacteriota bacterium]